RARYRRADRGACARARPLLPRARARCVRADDRAAGAATRTGDPTLAADTPARGTREADRARRAPLPRQGHDRDTAADGAAAARAARLRADRAREDRQARPAGRACARSPRTRKPQSRPDEPDRNPQSTPFCRVCRVEHGALAVRGDAVTKWRYY